MENETKKSTEIAIMGANDVPLLLEKVNAQIKALKGNLPDVAITDKEIPGFGKVESLKDLKTIIKAASSILGKEKAYKDAAAIVMPDGMKTPSFEVNGMGVKPLIDHLKQRAFVVGNDEKLKALANIKATLESNLSAEMKLANDLKKIQEIMMNV